LLIALFGGCLIGVGMGLCIRSGSVADGIEILALLTTRKGLNVSEVILASIVLFYPLLGFLVLVPRYTLLSLIFLPLNHLII
jgi:uncharacterized membrane-anchored protein YitT (DUF2179 family)